MRIKKALCVVLAASLAFGAVGCGKKKADTSDGTLSAARTMEGNDVYAQSPDFSIPKMEGTINTLCAMNDNIYFTVDEYTEMSMPTPTDASVTDASGTDAIDEYIAGTFVTHIYKMPKGTSDVEEVASITPEGNKNISRFFVDKDENLYVTETEWTESERNITALCKVENGDITDKKDISDITDVSGDSYLSRLLMTDNGDLVAQYNDGITIFDQDGKEKGKLSKGAEQDLDTVGIAQDGSIIASMTEYKEDKTNTIIKKLDPENAKVLEETTLEVYYLSDVIRGSGDYDFYFKKNDNIVGYNMKDKKEETVMSFIKSDINVDYISSTYVQDPENIYIASNDTEQMDMLALYNRVDPNELKDMKVLTVASLYGSYSIKQKVLEYNKSQKKVHVNMVDYSEADDPAAKISADIASGNLPDIYCLDMNGLGNLSTNQCIAKGLFADLTDLMANDPDANLDSLVPAVKKTLDHDGKVYFVSAAFDIVSMYGKKSEIGEGQGWTYQEMKDYVDSTDDKANMFFYSSKEDTLRELMATSGNDFVDWDKGEVHFDSADFKSVLEMCNRNHESEADGEEEYESDPEKLQNGKILFLEGTINPVEMKSYDKFFKGDVSYKGYPSKDSTGTFIRFDNSLAISSKCEDKDAAWEFIRNFITEDYQGSQYRSLDGMPTRQDVYEEYLHNYTVEKDGTDKYGNDIYALEGSFGYGELEVPVGPLSDDDIAAFQALVDSAEKSIVVDNNLVDIALEEAQAYFNGDKTVDEVTDIIQNRLGTYVNENK